MPKYTKEVKEQALQAALKGMHLKIVQTEIGPNPKAVERYIVKAHKAGAIKYASYKEVLADLKAKGIVPKTLRQESVDKKATKKAVKKANIAFSAMSTEVLE